MPFIQTPYLPMGPVSQVLIDGQRGREAAKALQKLGISSVKTAPCADLPQSLSTHPDLLLCPVAPNCMVAAPQAAKRLRNQLDCYNFNIVEGKSRPGEKYPYDVAYNVCLIGHVALHHEKYTDPVLKERLTANGYIFYHVNQGYTKCSVVVLSHKAIITQDTSIHAAAVACGINSLLIEPGHILLEGYPYGFIGGCCGLIDKNKLCITGVLHRHPQWNEIKYFFDKHEIEPVFLTDGPAFDIGTIIPLLEKQS